MNLFKFFCKDSKSLCISRYIIQTIHFQEKFSNPIVFIASRIVKKQGSEREFEEKKRRKDVACPEGIGRRGMAEG